MKESELGKTYNDGDIICHEGDEGKSMYVIQSGKVEVIKKRPEGELKLRIMTKGEIFGEIALFDHMPRSATVFNILEGMSKRIRDLTHELSKYKKDEELIS
jgi:CRP-like cAMP-binding protein